MRCRRSASARPLRPCSTSSSTTAGSKPPVAEFCKSPDVGEPAPGTRPVCYGARPMAAITSETVAAHGLSPDEFARIRKLLARDPNLVELGIFSAMWSEHCSYKSSRRFLRHLPTKGVRVLQG